MVSVYKSVSLDFVAYMYKHCDFVLYNATLHFCEPSLVVSLLLSMYYLVKDSIRVLSTAMNLSMDLD